MPDCEKSGELQELKDNAVAALDLFLQAVVDAVGTDEGEEDFDEDDREYELVGSIFQVGDIVELAKDLDEHGGPHVGDLGVCVSVDRGDIGVLWVTGDFDGGHDADVLPPALANQGWFVAPSCLKLASRRRVKSAD